MRIESIEDDKAAVILSGDEIALIGNCMNEALNAVELWEFSTRTGFTRDQALALHKEVCSLADKMRIGD